MMFGRKQQPDVGKNRATIDLHELSYDELASQKIAIDQELARRGSGELELLKSKLVSIAAALGISISDLFSQKKERKQAKATKVSVKYANPDNPAEQWSGRGKPPKWMEEKIEAGADKDRFAIS